MLLFTDALDFTQNWLQDTAKVLLTCRWEEQLPGVEAAAPRASVLSPPSLHNHAYLRLLKWDHAAAPFPEVHDRPQIAGELSTRIRVHLSVLVTL